MFQGILLTQYNGAILGPIAKILGFILNAIFNFLNIIHLPNVGLAIIIFTIVIYIALLPLTIKQQKFSKLSARMNPEIKAIQEKYKNKKDQDSLQRQNEEMQSIYKKYGVSPTGSCVQLIIQMPILFALYRVIYNVPAYVTLVWDSLAGLAEEIVKTAGGTDFIASLQTASQFSRNSDLTTVNGVIDVLNRASSAEWDAINAQFPDLTLFDSARTLFNQYNNFLGLNISDSPWFIIKNAFESGQWLLILGAVMIPVLSAATQWLNYIFMPQPNQGDTDNPMAQSMKSMNVMMPLMSAFFCFTLPCGMGIYWISGAVVRSIEQVMINKYIDKMDIDKLIEKNQEKYQKKLEKEGITGKNISSVASVSTKKIADSNSKMSEKEREAAVEKARAFFETNAKPGGIAAKANLVKEYNEKNKGGN